MGEKKHFKRKNWIVLVVVNLSDFRKLKYVTNLYVSIKEWQTCKHWFLKAVKFYLWIIKASKSHGCHKHILWSSWESRASPQ